MRMEGPRQIYAQSVMSCIERFSVVVIHCIEGATVERLVVVTLMIAMYAICRSKK